jgi:excisionase family DNA binding protein
MGQMPSSLKAPILPYEAEARMATELAPKIAARLGEGATLKLQVEGRKGEAEPLPPMAARLVLDMLEELARGNAVTVNAIEAEITTQQAADLLNISRPSLIELLNEGKLPTVASEPTGASHSEAVLAYKTKAMPSARRPSMRCRPCTRNSGSSDRRTAPSGLPRRQRPLPG